MWPGYDRKCLPENPKYILYAYNYRYEMTLRNTNVSPTCVSIMNLVYQNDIKLMLSEDTDAIKIVTHQKFGENVNFK